MTSPVLRANTDLVAVAWLGGVTGLTPAMVASQLPSDNSTWAASGFVTVRTSGGRPVLDNALRQPVVTVDTWACKPQSTKPPWNKANYLAECIVRACYPRTDAELRNVPRLLTLPAGYPNARVLSAYVVTEPRRSYGDIGLYASFTFDLALNWVDQS